MPFTLPDLPYAYDALEPTIDARTMEIHHSKHHQAYVTNANNALAGTSLENASVDEVLKNLSSLPQDKQGPVRNNAGGHANHSLFWTIMGPGGGGAAVGRARRRDRRRVRLVRRLQEDVRRERRRTVRLRLELARARRQRPEAVLHRQPGLPDHGRATRRCSASTSGSTRTTSTTRTAGPTTSRRGGTSSTGTPSRSASAPSERPGGTLALGRGV